jgi:hypothetical protein
VRSEPFRPSFRLEWFVEQCATAQFAAKARQIWVTAGEQHLEVGPGAARARGPADYRAHRAAPGAWQHRDRDDRYAQTPEICDRVMPMQHGEVTFESHAAATSAEEPLEIVRREYLAVCAG